MNAMKTAHWAWLACVVTSATAQSQQPPAYRAVAPVVVTSNEGLQRLTLPLPVLLASRSASYADVRLVSQAGQPLPMAWAQVPAAPAPVQRSVAVPRFAWPAPTGGSAASTVATAEQTRIRIDARGAVVEVQSTRGKTAAPLERSESVRWLLDLSQGRQPTEQIERLLLDWPTRPAGLSTQVQVQASDDAVTWKNVTTAALLELPGAGNGTVSLKHVAWPVGSASPRYVRLTFDAPVALSKTEVRWAQTAQRTPMPSAEFDFKQDAPQPPSTESSWSADLGGRLSLTQIELLGTELNTVTALRLEQRDDPAQSWQPVTSFVAWRLQRQGAEQRSAATEVPGTAARYWRLVRDARTSQPGGGTLRVRLAWQAPELVFATANAQGIELHVGADRATGSTVPLATLIPAYESGAEHRLPAAQVGALVAVPWREPTLWQRLTSPSPEQRKQWLLWAALAAAVIGLGVLAMRLSRDIAGQGSTK